MNAAAAAAAVVAGRERPFDAGGGRQEAITFSDDGKRVMRRSLSQRVMRSMRRVESVANFLDRPVFPKSDVPEEVGALTRLR